VETRPIEPGGNDSGGDRTIDARFEDDFATRVEGADPVTVVNAARARIGSVHFQVAQGWLELADRGYIGER
jgi:hypothetical protein